MLGVSWFLCGILYALFYFYIFNKLVNRKTFNFTLKITICSVLFAFIYFLIMYYNSGVIQPYLTNLLLLIFIKFIYKERFVKTIICTFLIFVAACFSELIYDLIMTIGFHIDLLSALKSPYVFVVSNLLILLGTSLIFQSESVTNFSINLITWYNANERRNTVVFVILAMIIDIFVMYNNFVNLLPSSFLILTNMFFLCVLVFVIGFFKEKSNNHRIQTEYDQMMDYVKVYENILEEKSKNQHEYRNQMIMIREMVKEEEAIEYINQLLNIESNMEDNEWLNKLKYVPLGGLKGLIHYKIQEMLKKNIQIFVDVSPQLEKYEKNKTLHKYLEDISKIIGVYLDNAIEAVKDLKEKYIIIEFYIEKNYIVFSLSNNYEGIIDVSKIENEKYTTKGQGHGYGLSLVKDILSKNEKLTQKRELNGIYFVQKLCIKK